MNNTYIRGLLEEVYFLVNIVDGTEAVTLTGYTANASYNDESKYKLTCTIEKDGVIVTDSNDDSMDHIPVFANGTTYSQGTTGTPYGFDVAGEYEATVWITKRVSGTLTRRKMTIIPFTVKDKGSADPH
jgi:hypothetical protein